MTTPPFEFSDETGNFWLKYDAGPWQRVSKKDYLLAESGAGFHGGAPGEPSTASFGRTAGGRSVRGATFTPLEVEQHEQDS